MLAATGAFRQAFHEIETSLSDTTNRVAAIRQRTSDLVDQTESMVQDSVSVGAKTDDTPFIDRVQSDAAKVAHLFESAIEAGQISTADLFSRSYTTIPSTNPEQKMTPFTRFTDQVLR